MKKLISFIFLISLSFTLFAQSDRSTLKGYFETGDKPTQAEFADQIDSQYNLSEDNSDSIPEGSTNLFLTTSERSKLLGIEALAEVNNMSDADATELTDASETILHSHAGGGASPLTTKGDIFTYSTVDARLPIGINGYLLTPKSTETTGQEWTNALPINISFGGGLTISSIGVGNGIKFGDSDTEIYEIGDDKLLIKVGGGTRGTWDVFGLTSSLWVTRSTLYGNSGFTSFFSNIQVSVGSSIRCEFSTGASSGISTGMYSLNHNAAGTPTVVTYGFKGNTNTGMFRIASNNLGHSCGGTQITDWTLGQQKFLGQLIGGSETELTATSITFDMNNGNTQEVVLSDNLSTWGISNAVAGAEYTIWIIQDGTGSRTISDPTTGVTHESGQSIGTPLTTANDINIYKFYVSPSGTVVWSLDKTVAV